MICPICKKPVNPPREGERSFSPFCSERCKLIDLGRWLDGKYQIPVSDVTDNDSRPSDRSDADR